MIPYSGRQYIPKLQYSTGLLDNIKKHEANAAIGITTLRGQPKGTRQTVIEFLGKIKLGRIPRRSHADFNRWLDRQTHSLRHLLPSRGKPWGIARKSLNLFLRSCVYNHHLRKAHGLSALEHLLETPLDGVVARALKRDNRDIGKGDLPPWPGLKHLTSMESKKFQEYATHMARRMKLPSTVFLDNIFFIDNH